MKGQTNCAIRTMPSQNGIGGICARPSAPRRSKTFSCMLTIFAEGLDEVSGFLAMNIGLKQQDKEVPEMQEK